MNIKQVQEKTEVITPQDPLKVRILSKFFYNSGVLRPFVGTLRQQKYGEMILDTRFKPKLDLTLVIVTVLILLILAIGALFLFTNFKNDIIREYCRVNKLNC